MESQGAATAVDGVWKMVCAEFAGKSALDLDVQNTILVFDRNCYQVPLRGEMIDAGTCERFDIQEGSAQIFRGTVDTNAISSILCLYQLAGARLRLLLQNGQETAVEFLTIGRRNM